jgi:hypothetical protein
MVTGIPELQEEYEGICRGCTLGKNTKGPYPSSDSRSRGIFDLVQSDVCGPMTLSYLVGLLYYVIFIDDFSRKTWIYFINTKDEVFSRFQELKARVENLIGNKIKVLRTDNGGEYTSKEFNDFYRKEGIKRELIVPYNPHQNGVEKRNKNSIVEAVNGMIHDQNLPLFLWKEASNETVYIQNKIPHRILEDKTPEDAFRGLKPKVNHLRIFGCPLYIHVPKEKTVKLELSGKEGNFVGYSETSKAYIIYILGQHQIKVNHDVTFNEEISFKRSGESHIEIVSEEKEALKDDGIHPTSPTDHPSYHQEEPRGPMDLPRYVLVTRKRLAWLRDTLQDVEGHATPCGTFRDRKRPKRFSSYMALMIHIIDS